MARIAFDNYGSNEAFLEHKDGKVASFVAKSGGPVDAFGDWEKKDKTSDDMNAGEAFNKSDYTKVEASGTDYPKKKSKQRSDNTGDHFSVGEVDPSGNDAAKSKSFQSDRRA